MPAKQNPDMVTTTVRLPRSLIERIDALAESERRSRNQMITVLLERAAQ